MNRKISSPVIAIILLSNILFFSTVESKVKEDIHTTYNVIHKFSTIRKNDIIRLAVSGKCKSHSVFGFKTIYRGKQVVTGLPAFNLGNSVYLRSLLEKVYSKCK